MRVKVCGITRVEDARLAADLGAWAVGFIFWPKSPRFVEPARARAIVEALPAYVLPVGVFVNQPAGEVEEVGRLVRLGAVQLHGDESPAYAAAMTRRVIKAMSPDRALGGEPERDWGATTLLLDATEGDRRGGTGRTVDWDIAAAVARRRPVVLAGGLGPANIAEAIQIVRPAAVDVSSGLERVPGEKDAALMEALFKAVAGVHEEVR